jgi:hypothetical protein
MPALRQMEASMVLAPKGPNDDEWHLFLSHYLDNRATQPNGLNHVAMQISDAIQRSFDLGFRAAGGSISTLAPAKRSPTENIEPSV